MSKYKSTIVIILLVVAAIIAGCGFASFVSEHIWLSLLMLFSIVGAFAIEKEV